MFAGFFLDSQSSVDYRGGNPRVKQGSFVHDESQCTFPVTVLHQTYDGSNALH